MKKIININLSGRLIPIEDTAYDILKGYIESLKRHFANEEGRDEIMGDIESRIAELFQEKIKAGAHCITDEDVQTVMSSIGRPEDLEDNEEAGTASASAQTEGAGYDFSSVPRSRLSRNVADRILGGVCSGIAHSLRVDPSLVRILFALITFGGFGLGFLIYIILWIVLPKSVLEPNIEKRLFRNPDEKVLGGVCGGLAAYFKMEVWIPRLVFAAPLIFNIGFSVFGGSWLFNMNPGFVFGSLSGTFILAYIILWVVVPMASTTSERLQMRGQKVDLSNIKNTVKEELQSVKEKSGKIGADIREGAHTAAAQGRKIAAEFGQAVRPQANGLGHAIGVLFRAIFLCIAGLIALALFFMLIALFGVGVGTLPFKDYLLETSTQNLLAWGTLILFFAVPIIGFILWLIRKIMGVKTQNRYLGYTFAVLWIIGLFCAVGFGTEMARSFNTRVHVDEAVPLNQPANGKLLVRVADERVKVHSSWGFGRWISTSDDSLRLKNIRLKISKSPDSLYHMNIERYSRGRNGRQAESLASKIRYEVKQSDSLLLLNNGFSILRGEVYRGQQLELVIGVPVGKRIMVDRSVSRRFVHFDTDWYDEDWDNDEDWESNVEYIMTIGGLERVGRSERKVDSTDTPYRYRRAASQMEELRHSIETEKERIRLEIKERTKRVVEENKKRIEEHRKMLKSIRDTDLGSTETDAEPEIEGKSGGRNAFGNLFSPWVSMISRMR